MKTILISFLAVFAISAPIAALDQDSWHKAQHLYGKILQAPLNATDYISSFFTLNESKPVRVYTSLTDPKNSANVTMGSIPVYMGSYGYFKYKMWQFKKTKSIQNYPLSGNFYGEYTNMPKEPSRFLNLLKHPIKTMRRAAIPVITITLVAPTLTGFAHHVACSE